MLTSIASALWRLFTEPVETIQPPEARQQARSISAIVLLTLLLVSTTLIQRALDGALSPYLIEISVLAALVYLLSRSKYYRTAGIVTIVGLWLMPVYNLVTGVYYSPVFIFATIRFAVVAVMLTYILFSLRVTVAITLLITLSFWWITPHDVQALSPPELAFSFLGTAGAVFLLFAITRQYDRTVRQQTESALSASEQRYRAIVEMQSELVCRWLPDTTLTYVNDAFCRSTGKTYDQLVGTRFETSLAKDDLRIMRDAVNSLTPDAPTVSHEHRITSRSGETRWLQWTDHAIYDESGTVIEYQSVGRDVSERKATEEALSASEKRYRAIVEIQTEMICRWLPDHTITFVNEAYCRYFGRSRLELLGSEVLAFIFEDDLAHVSAMIAQMSAEKPTVTYEHRVLRDGEVCWHQWTDQAIFDEHGQIVEYQSVGRDVTSLKNAEEAEREQRQFAEALSSTSALITSTLKLEEVLDRILNQVAFVNPLNSAELLLIEGDTARIVRSRGYSDPAQRRSLMRMRLPITSTRNLREMIETGEPIIIPDVRVYFGWVDTVESRWIRSMVGAPIRLEGETIGFLSINSEKPDRFTKQHAQRLQAFADQAAIAIRNARLYDEVRRYASELEGLVRERTAELELTHQRLRAILDGTGEGIFYTERDIIQYASLAFCKQTGYTPEELIGGDYHILYDDDNAITSSEMVAAIREELARRSVWRGEARIRRKDGTAFDAGLTIATVGGMDEQEQPYRAVTVVRDISSEKVLQAQRSNLVAYASHELRTPITNMKTRLYLLRRRPEALDEHLAILDEVTERMKHLVEDLLDISRLEHGLIPLRRKDLILQEVIRTVVTLQKPEAEIKALVLNCDLPDEPVAVSADRERLIQVITNLVTNALNYTPKGGTITVGLTTGSDTAIIQVSDTGIGIASENLPYIFQPFYRVVSQVEGTGLGLSIAREIIEMHSGSITVRSEPGRGSTFTITLPLLASEPVR